MLNRYNRLVYLCQRLGPEEDGYQEGIDLFHPPVSKRLNLRSVSGEAILVSGGELAEKTLIARMPEHMTKDFRENDRVFVHKTPSAEEEFDPAAPGGDYRVVSVLPGFQLTEIILERVI